MPTDEIGTVKDACAEIGGTKPIDPSTYYRGVKAGRFPPPYHPSPGVVRVNLTKLRERIHQNAEIEASAPVRPRHWNGGRKRKATENVEAAAAAK